MSSALTANTAGLVIDLNKNNYILTGSSAGGGIVDSVSVNKELGTVTITGDGTVSTVYLRDFADFNIIHVNLTAMAESTNKSIVSIAESTNREITVRASTKPG